jgi:hypothetical protein
MQPRRHCVALTVDSSEPVSSVPHVVTEVIIGAPCFKNNREMQNISNFMPHERSFLEIEVKANDVEDTFQTNLRCSRDHCGEIVNIDGDGPKTVQSVSCPKHGFLISFRNKIALGEFVRFLANEILAANGHKLIEQGATSIFDGDGFLPKGVN